MAVSHAFSNAVADFTGTVTGFNSQGSTITLAASNMVKPSDWNSAHNQYITLAGNTNNASTVSGSNIVWSGGNNVTLIGDGASIGISAGDGFMISRWCNVPQVAQNASTRPTLASQYVFPFTLPFDITMDRIRFLSSISFASTTFASTANTTFSYNEVQSHRWVLYTQGTGASSASLMSISSGSNSLHWSINAGYGSASNTQQQHSFGFTYYNFNGSTSSFSTIYSASNSSQIVISNNNLTGLNGMRFGEVPAVGSLSAGVYWLAVQQSTTATTQATNLSGVRFQDAFVVLTHTNQGMAPFGSINATSYGLSMGMGIFTSTTTAAAIPFSSISTTQSSPVPVIYLGNNFI